MTTPTIISFICGGLFATLVYLILTIRGQRLDESVIRHIRSKAYNEGWQDGRDSKFQGE